MQNPLEIPLERALSLSSTEQFALEKAGLLTVGDLLYCFPTRYEDFSSPKRIIELGQDEKASISGTVVKIGPKTMFGKRTPVIDAYIEDAPGDRVRAIWFYQPSVAKSIPEGSKIRLSGKVKKTKKGSIYFINPLFEPIAGAGEIRLFADDGTITPLPVYPQLRGISSRWIGSHIEQLLHLASQIPDPLPPEILKTYHLPSLKTALSNIHKPKSAAWATAARKRFAFEEIFFIQLHRIKMRKLLLNEPAFSINIDIDPITEIEQQLSFPLTTAQKRAARQILGDLSESHPMARLLEGDVGSGKTLVAVIAALAAVRAGYQVAYMAPTEILARQHFEAFSNYLKPFHIKVGLVTSSEFKVFPSKVSPNSTTHISKSQLLIWAREGVVPILIGTHALLQEKVGFKKLALVIVDEQHRFGVAQRGRLTQQAKMPHLLSMTATPIPRTLALTIYGDLDLSLLDIMPPGRKKPITKIVPPDKRAAAYEFIRKNISAGGQAFVICPMIEIQQGKKTQFSDSKAVTEEYKKLKEDIFPEFEIGMLHGKLKSKEKEEIVKTFRQGKTQILVSTSVIEVGIDIPNASVMIIEGAERFGLASLHQFRGRVGRAGQTSYCLVFTDSRSPNTKARLDALVKAKNGFELAEYDLALRGPGELSGSSQWGVSDLGMEALKNIKMVEAAREEAAKMLEEDPNLRNYPLLKEKVASMQKDGLHFE